MLEDNQGDILLVKNRQVCIHNKTSTYATFFLRNTAEGKYMEINCIRRKENPTDIITKNSYEANHVKHTKRTTEVKLQDIVETERENVNNNVVTDGVMYYVSTEYSSHTLNNNVNQINGSECVLVTRYRNGNKIWIAY